MAENPLTKLARLAGGAAMLPGPLGYKVLGQLLISRSTGTELAGANVVLAAVSRQTNAAVQIAVRSMVPAVLVEALNRKEQQQLDRLNAELMQKLQQLEARSAEVRDKPERMIEARQKLETLQPLDEALLIETLKLRSQGGPPERRVEALQHILDKYVPVLTAVVQKQLDAKPVIVAPETKTDTVPEGSSAPGNQAADAIKKSDARTTSNAMVKMKKTKKKLKSKGKGKNSIE